MRIDVGAEKNINQNFGGLIGEVVKGMKNLLD